MSKAIKSRNFRITHLTSAHGALDVRIFHKECRSLARAGYEVLEIGNFSSDDSVDGVRIRGLGLCSGRVHRSTVGLLRICREAFRASGDLYHIHDPELLIVGLILRASGRKVIYDIHEDLPSTVLFKAYLPRAIRKPLMWIIERLENAVAQHMSGLVAATPALADRFRPTHNNTVAVNNFVRLEEFTPSTRVEWNRRAPAVTYFGGISEERGIREMLAAMDLLPASLGVKLELGGCFYVKELYAELAAGPQWRHVNWYGELERAALTSLLERVQVGLVILHPDKAYLNSHPTKLFEYMAAGIPVIASDFPLWCSIIKEAGCGILVNPFDSREIAAAIEHLITNPHEAEEMGKRGRKAVEERFNWSNEEQVLLSFYAALLPQSAALEVEAVVA
jgi:glycosyltransferase involved in cell wall biosynthesis